jgi:hypothetical protein
MTNEQNGSQPLSTGTSSKQTWLLRHERLVIVALVLAAGVFTGQRGLDYLAHKADLGADKAIAQLRVDVAVLQGQTAQAAKNEVQYQAMLDTLQKQNATLAAAIAQDNASLSARQAQDRGLPLPGLAGRWETILALPQGDLTANSTGIQVSIDGVQRTVTALEQVPTLNDELSKETQVAANNAALLGQSQTVNAGLTKQVGDLQGTLADQQKACTAQIAQAKADGDKKAMRWAKVGVIIGGILGGFIGHAL